MFGRIHWNVFFFKNKELILRIYKEHLHISNKEGPKHVGTWKRLLSGNSRKNGKWWLRGEKRLSLTGDAGNADDKMPSFCLFRQRNEKLTAAINESARKWACGALLVGARWGSVFRRHLAMLIKIRTRHNWLSRATALSVSSSLCTCARRYWYRGAQCSAGGTTKVLSVEERLDKLCVICSVRYCASVKKSGQPLGHLKLSKSRSQIIPLLPFSGFTFKRI